MKIRLSELRELIRLEITSEAKKKAGLWANIHARRRAGKRRRRPGEKGYPATLDINEAAPAQAPVESPQRLWGIMYKAKNLIAHLGRRFDGFMKKNAIELLGLFGSGDVKYLGGGIRGDAFLLPNGHVLKLEAEEQDGSAVSGGIHDKWQGILFSGRSLQGERLGRLIPMVYDSGTLVGPNGERVNWGEMERFTPVKEVLSDSEVRVLNKVMMKYHSARRAEPDLEVIAKYVYEDRANPYCGEALKTIGATLGLDASEKKLASDVTVSRWVMDLLAMMEKLKGRLPTDFHAGNLGIRHLGGWENELVFFD